jgi:FkbM family methyltransferase
VSDSLIGAKLPDLYSETLVSLLSAIKAGIRPLVPGPVRRALRHASNWGFKPYLTTMRVGEFQFNFWVADRVGEDWYGSSSSLSPEMEFTRAMIHESDVVFEVGGHHGFTTLLLAQMVGPNGTVVVFEASPHNAEILRKNLAANDVRNVIVEAQAVGDQVGHARISQDYNARVVLKGDAQRDVPLTTLDRFAHLRPAVLKIDVEGFEVEVLRGARDILATRPRLAIEIHVPELTTYGHTPNDVLAFLDRRHYGLWLQSNTNAAPAPYDGQPIVADRQVHLYAIPS